MHTTISKALRSIAALAFVLAVSVLNVPTFTMAAEMRCDFHARHACTARGCSPIMPSDIYVRLNMAERRYGRCDDKRPCDWYPMSVHAAGGFVDLDFRPGLQGAKMSADGSIFIEITSALDAIVVSYGSCAPEG